MDPITVSNLLGTWGYPALLLLLILTGVGSPIPEDLLLLTAGYLVFTEVFDWLRALVISLIGVVVSDLLLYSAGRHLAWRSARGSEGGVLSDKRLQRTTRWFGRLRHGVIFIARLTPGTRALVFLTAGARAVPVLSFLRYDLSGAVLWVPAMLAVGHAFGNRIGDLPDALGWLNRSAVWAMAVAALLLLIWLSRGPERIETVSRLSSSKSAKVWCKPQRWVCQFSRIREACHG